MKKAIFYAFAVLFWSMYSPICQAQTYDEWIERSCNLLDTDSLEAAADALQQALRLEPANARNGMLLGNLGTVQRQLGRLADAEQSYTAALGFMPHSRSILNSRAALYADMEQYDKAADDYTSLLLETPDDEETLYQRALCRLMANDTLGARYDLEHLDQVNPQSAKARLGMAYIYKAQGHYREAAELYDALLERNPRNARLLRERAEVHYLNRRMGAALNDANQSLLIDPSDPYCLLLRAQIRYARRDKEYALRDLRQALSLGLPEAEARTLLEQLK